MQRRCLLLSLPAIFLSAGAAFAQTADALASAFAALSPEGRRAVQEQLAFGGFYDGSVDGAYGPRTRSALINAAALIRENSYSRERFTLSDQADAQRYMTALARGDLAKYLWGEGDESEGG